MFYSCKEYSRITDSKINEWRQTLFFNPFFFRYKLEHTYLQVKESTEGMRPMMRLTNSKSIGKLNNLLGRLNL